MYGNNKKKKRRERVLSTVTDTQQQLKAILLGSISLLRALLPRRIPIKIDLRLHPRATTVSPVVPLVFKGCTLEQRRIKYNVSFPKYYRV